MQISEDYINNLGESEIDQNGKWNGHEIKQNSEAVAYTYVISIVILTFRRSTRFYLTDAEKDKALIALLLCTVCNLTLGWWGLPWGPIYTIKETICNFVKPRKYIVGERY